jgi:hypothetical protein
MTCLEASALWPHRACSKATGFPLQFKFLLFYITLGACSTFSTESGVRLWEKLEGEKHTLGDGGDYRTALQVNGASSVSGLFLALSYILLLANQAVSTFQPPIYALQLKSNAVTDSSTERVSRIADKIELPHPERNSRM